MMIMRLVRAGLLDRCWHDEAAAPVQASWVSISDAAVAPNRHESRIAATRQPTLLGIGGEVVNQINNQATPSGLVAGTNAGTIVAMEVLIK